MRLTRTAPSRSSPGSPTSWLSVLRRYALFVGPANLVWETLHLPLYALWQQGTPAEVAFAVVHCTAGDVLIALASLGVALVLAGGAAWPVERFVGVTAVAVVLGVAYTLYSEWLNVTVRGTWAYSNAMPVVPPLGTGLSPLLQWLILPPLGLAWARRGGAAPVP